MRHRSLATLILIALALIPVHGWAQTALPTISLTVGDAESGGQLVTGLKVLFLLTVLTLAPAILVMVTSFTRIIVVLSFLRQAMGLQSVPPNPVLVGLALFLTFFVMAPVWQQINGTALQPYLAGELSEEVAWERAKTPLATFMLAQTREKDLQLFLDISKTPTPETQTDLPLQVVVPAFVISELKTAFQIGFLLYLPFLVLDMVVSSVLMSMGMMMLPPVVISLPFKLILFVLVDGWNLVVGAVVGSFY
ncbi:MAG: flagellar type III secretion system pore protein FliP [Nitrospirae bacterium]|nr:flagellar type III secretion system pore protein FliP [Nitrospirota bacterium]